jgi:P-type Ca2+ transporter type 2C
MATSGPVRLALPGPGRLTRRQFVRYLLTTNSGEIWVLFLASVLALPVPVLPVQILWINLVTDGLPAIALGLEPVEHDANAPPAPCSDPSRSSPVGCGSTPCGSA